MNTPTYDKGITALLVVDPYNRGSRERPLSDDELAVKFSENCRRALAPETTEALRSSIDRITQAKDLSEIVRILATVRG